MYIHILTFAESCAISYLMQMARKKIPVGLALDPELLAVLDKWRAAQVVTPSRTAAIEQAIRDFLERGHGGDE